jgi:small GTP-binding protein
MSHEIKVVLLGDTAVGKSSLVLRFVTNCFERYSESTIGASFMSKVIVLDGHAVKLQIWDTAGQEKYRSLAPMYYRNAAAAIVVYDITQAQSFVTLKNWVKELQTLGPEKVVIAICGNKLDQEDRREVSRDEAEAFAKEVGALHIETSAKTAANVNKLFESLARAVPAREVSVGSGMGGPQSNPASSSVQLRGGGRGVEEAKAEGGGCC